MLVLKIPAVQLSEREKMQKSGMGKYTNNLKLYDGE